MAGKLLSGNSEKALFLSLFVIAGLIASRINYSQLLGAPNQFFTLFQFFAPIAGGFLGGIFGAAVVLATQLIDFLITGKAFTLLNLARLLPLVFAAWYFANSDSREKISLTVPLLAIVLFIANPIGQQVWYYAVFWTIPIIAKLFFADSLIAKSLGATFTAHAVGGVVWIYSLQTTPEFWIGLIPVVIYERLLFAGGIAVSFVALNALFSRVRLPQFIKVDYLLPFAAKATSYSKMQK